VGLVNSEHGQLLLGQCIQPRKPLQHLYDGKMNVASGFSETAELVDDAIQREVWPIMAGKPPLATHVRLGSRASQRGRIRKTFPSHLIPIGNDKRARDYPFSEAGSGSIQTASIATMRLFAGKCILAFVPNAFPSIYPVAGRIPNLPGNRRTILVSGGATPVLIPEETGIQ
jgi:hypothetical protein